MALDLFAPIRFRDHSAARSWDDLDGNQVGFGSAPLEAGAGEQL